MTVTMMDRKCQTHFIPKNTDSKPPGLALPRQDTGVKVSCGSMVPLFGAQNRQPTCTLE